MDSEFPKFHPNPFTSGGVIAERANIVQTRRKVFAILGEASASSPSNNHSHSDTVANEIVQAMRTTCKRKATENTCERPSKVIRTVLGDQDDFDVTSSDINNVRAAMYRERRKYCGTLPHNVDETLRTLKQLPMYTTRREDFLCCCEATNDGGGFVVFRPTTKSNLVTLCNADVITMDGTFGVCPKFFHQLHTVHGYIPFGLSSCVFIQFCHAFLYTFVVRFYTLPKCVFVIN